LRNRNNIRKNNQTTIRINNETYEHLKRNSYYYNKTIANVIDDLVQQSLTSNYNNNYISDFFEDKNTGGFLENLKKPSTTLNETHKRCTFIIKNEYVDWLDRTAAISKQKRFKTDFINFAIKNAIEIVEEQLND